MSKVHRFDPDYVVPTSEVLREWLDDNHLSTQVAAAMGYVKGEPRQWAAGILDKVLADQPVDEIVATVLAAVTGISARFWRNFEHNYRVGLKAGKVVAGA